MGFSLVEFMVASVIGLFLLAGLIQMFQQNRTSHRMNESLSRLQENGRFATQLFSDTLRMAGYAGCVQSIRCATTPADQPVDLNDGARQSLSSDGLGRLRVDPPCVNNLLDAFAASSANLPYGPAFALTSGVSGWEFTGSAPGNTVVLTAAAPAMGNANQWTDWGATNNLLPELAAMALPGNDILVVKRLVPLTGRDPSSDRLTLATPVLSSLDGTLPHASQSVTVQYGSNAVVPQGTLIAISDCQGADIFQNRATTPTPSGGALVIFPNATGVPLPGNYAATPASLTHTYDLNQTEVAQLEIVVFYVGVGMGGQPTLFRTFFSQDEAGSFVNDTNGRVLPEELVEGVENMQILYGVDTDADAMPNTYLPVNQITSANASNISAVRIGLLLRSVDALAIQTDTRNYLLGGSTPAAGVIIDPVNEKRLRYTLNATIQLRNR
jgi:type IV pilus assembly protein PilW